MTGVINLFLSVVSTTVERLVRRCGTYAYRKSADLKTLGFAGGEGCSAVFRGTRERISDA